MRRPKLTRHHLTPKSRGGNRLPNNKVRLATARHIAWHLAFQNKTLWEILSSLEAMDIVFPNKSAKDIRLMLLRLARVKGHVDPGGMIVEKELLKYLEAHKEPRV